MINELSWTDPQTWKPGSHGSPGRGVRGRTGEHFSPCIRWGNKYHPKLLFLWGSKKLKLYLTTNYHIDMSELGSDENWLELGHVFPEQVRIRLCFIFYILCSVLLPVSIHKYYVDNIITNMSFPFNLKCKEVVNKNRVESSASLLTEQIYSALDIFFSKFCFRKQRKSFWAAISSIRSQGFSIWFPFIFDTNGGDKSRKWNGEIKIVQKDNCLESCQNPVGTQPHSFESSH